MLKSITLCIGGWGVGGGGGWGGVGGGGGSARQGPYAGSMSFLFIIVPIPSLVGPLSRPKSHVSFPKRRSQRGVLVSRA